MDEEELPSANANPVINGLECPPPPSLLKHMLRGKTYPTEVMQLTSLYYMEFNNNSRYGTDDFSTLFSNVLSSLLIVLRQGLTKRQIFLC
ncbi:TPA: hypothetical protein ACH3X1_011062 [Trebouxia sp. C0004]